jgi:MFS family permease
MCYNGDAGRGSPQRKARLWLRRALIFWVEGDVTMALPGKSADTLATTQAMPPTQPDGRRRKVNTFAALRHRNYRLWFFGQMVSLMGTWMQSMAQGWVVYQLTGSRLLLGTVSFIGSIPTLFLMLPAGVLADRVPKKTILLCTQTTMMILAFVLAGLAATGVLQVWHIVVLAVLLGTANACDGPARQALAVEMVDDRRDLMNAIALNSTMFNIGRIAGPALAGIVLAAVGAAWCFFANGLSFVAVLAALLAMRLPQVPRASRSEGLVKQMLVGLRYAWTNVSVRAITAVVGVSTLSAMSYAVLFPVFAADVYKVGEAGLSLLNVAMGTGALVGSLLAASLSEYRFKGRLLTLGNLLLPLALVGFACAPWFPMALLFLVLAGSGQMIQNAMANTLVQTLVPDELRGRVMSAYMLVFFGAMPFGSLQMGAMAQAVGPRLGVAIGAVVALGFALFTLAAVPRIRRLEI